MKGPAWLGLQGFRSLTYHQMHGRVHSTESDWVTGGPVAKAGPYAICFRVWTLAGFCPPALVPGSEPTSPVPLRNRTAPDVLPVVPVLQIWAEWSLLVRPGNGWAQWFYNRHLSRGGCRVHVLIPGACECDLSPNRRNVIQQM